MTDFRTLFYWLSIADNAKNFFVTFVSIFTTIAIVSTIAYLSNGENSENQKMSRKWMWWSYPFMILFWSLFIFTPSRKDALLIVAGGTTMNFLTQDSTAKELPKDLMNFVSAELKQMASEAKVSLELNKTKEEILKEAKEMPTEKLLEKMRLDTTFAKMIIDSK